MTFWRKRARVQLLSRQHTGPGEQHYLTATGQLAVVAGAGRSSFTVAEAGTVVQPRNTSSKRQDVISTKRNPLSRWCFSSCGRVEKLITGGADRQAADVRAACRVWKGFRTVDGRRFEAPDETCNPTGETRETWPFLAGRENGPASRADRDLAGGWRQARRGLNPEVVAGAGWAYKGVLAGRRNRPARRPAWCRPTAVNAESIYSFGRSRAACRYPTLTISERTYSQWYAMGCNGTQ